ncbi:MAG TPA: glucosyltransferase domain-containing protein, partial [Candidatus Avilachnospira avistercoris]|nr:glucosyltransferase domain-containing protein [Candidatus Avilachnospira avistercoris]
MNSICRRFLKESKEAAERFYGFLCCHKGVMLMLALLLLFLYGQRIVYYPMSIDSEIALQYQDGMIESWIAMDRFGSGFTKWLFGFSRFVPYASVFMMLIALFLFGMGFDFCVYEWTGDEKGYGLFYYIFPAAFVSAPCLAEQFYFTLQCFEIAFAMVLSLLAVYAMSRWAYFHESRLWAILGMAFMVWAFGTYQAFIPFYIALTLIAFILWYLRDDTYPSPEAEASKEGVRIGTGIFAKLSTPFRLGLLQAAVFAAGFLIYIIIAQIVKSTIEFETAYVGSMFKWREI